MISVFVFHNSSIVIWSWSIITTYFSHYKRFVKRLSGNFYSFVVIFIAFDKKVRLHCKWNTLWEQTERNRVRGRERSSESAKQQRCYQWCLCDFFPSSNQKTYFYAFAHIEYINNMDLPYTLCVQSVTFLCGCWMNYENECNAAATLGITMTHFPYNFYVFSKRWARGATKKHFRFPLSILLR